jgi:hypothetical protein
LGYRIGRGILPGMSGTTIKLNPRQLGGAIRSLAKSFDHAVIDALRKTARYGATAAIRVSAKSSPRPRALGTFERSFLVTRLPDGAALSNTARHGIFVEVGRKPGKMPPIQAILDWLIAKKIGANPAKLRGLAFGIARKIGRVGTKGRFVLRRTVPIMAKRLPIEIQAAMSRAISRAASRGGK